MKEISNRPNKNRRKRINQTNPMNIEKCLFSTIKCCTPMSSNLYIHFPIDFGPFIHF